MLKEIVVDVQEPLVAPRMKMKESFRYRHLHDPWYCDTCEESGEYEYEDEDEMGYDGEYYGDERDDDGGIY